jgi:hypothetical protein
MDTPFRQVTTLIQKDLSQIQRMLQHFNSHNGMTENKDEAVRQWK